MPNTIFIPSRLDIIELVAGIAIAHPDWQTCFLANNGAPVVGILPKISWQLLPGGEGLSLLTQTRKSADGRSAYQQQLSTGSYQQLLDILTEYSIKQRAIDTTTDTDNNRSAADVTAFGQGLMGFIGYDIAAHALNSAIEITKNQPACFFGHYDVYLTPTDGGFVLHFNDDSLGVLTKQISDKIQQIELSDLINPTKVTLKPVWTQADYAAAFYRSQDYLLAGDGYQINLTMPWQAHLQTNPALLAAHLPGLMTMSRAAFGGYLQLDGFEMLSISPELFFSFNNPAFDAHAIDIITKPIKGTRPRSADAPEDEQLKNELANSEKDLAENLMIVDLLRNDLGKYAKTGKVSTPKRFAIESFYNVHHMVSTVKARMDERHHPLSVLFGSLPAGSITGAPKKRACEMINEIECQPRGAYCGSLGFLNFDGTGQFNVLIRTIQSVRSHDSQMLSVWAGGGITVASQMTDEYQECHDKVGAILAALT